MQNENEVVQNDGLLDDPLDDFVDVPEVPTPEPPVIDAADIPQSENIQYPIKNDDYTEQKFPGQVQDFYMNKTSRVNLMKVWSDSDQFVNNDACIAFKHRMSNGWRILSLQFHPNGNDIEFCLVKELPVE